MEALGVANEIFLGSQKINKLNKIIFAFAANMEQIKEILL